MCALNNGEGPYGNTKVVKLECVNHVEKRFGFRLKKLRDEIFDWKINKQGKRYKRKLISGKDKLTDPVIGSIQFYYGHAIRSCVGKPVSELKNRILGIFYHCGSTNESP